MSRHGAEWVYGRHAVEAVLAGDPAGVLEIWIESELEGGTASMAERAAAETGLSIKRVHRRTLRRHLGDVVHQGIAVRYRATAPRATPDLASLLGGAGDEALLVLLDGVTDPHNLGAILRTADAAGVTAVIAPRRRAAGLTPAARKVASGAAETVPFLQVGNLSEAMARLAQAGVRLVGAAGDASTAYCDADLKGPLALVLGGEDRGLRRLTRERCDQLVRVPMAGVVESLNVSVTAGVLLFEARRQRVAPRGPID